MAEEEKISSNIEVIEIAKFPDVLTIKADEENDITINDKKKNGVYHSFEVPPHL